MDREMTSEEIEKAHAAFAEWIKDHPPFSEQDENGIDLSLIRANLKLNPTERILGAQRAANFLVEFLNGIKRH